MAFIEVVNSNDEKQLVPAHWLDHPTLSKGFRRSRRSQSQTPAQRVSTVATTGAGDSKAGDTSADTETAPSADQEG